MALASVLLAPGSYGPALAAVVANHLAILTASLLPRSSLLGPNVTRLWADGDDREQVVALTFDDGPDPEVTPAVLELLKAAGARATFFCVGARAESSPDLITAIRAGGHGVENHTYSHPNGFALGGPGAMEREIVRAQEALEDPAAGRPRLFRSPAGMQNPWLAIVLARTALSLVSWTRRGFDTVSRDGGRVAARLERGLRAGDILLLHDGRSARDARGRPVVLEALPRILDRMGRSGLRSEALHAILGQRG
ncbi:MAG TPA: polysaccharide deacetylase family protein [Thermoanaerobaculia bacterium]|nr:polysaccharide deacetylase family protein [Thermoanaerobaculia bacterium]